MRRTVRRILFVAIGALYVISIPWYRSAGAQPAFVLGLPDWVAVALGCYVGVAFLTSIAWLLTDVEDAPEPRAGDPTPASPGPPGPRGDRA